MDKRKNKLIKELKKFKIENKIEKMYLFGSRVSGKIHKWSDIDLLTVSKQFRGKGVLDRAPKLYLKWTLNYPVDFLCYTPSEFNKLKKEVSIVSEVVKKGIEI